MASKGPGRPSDSIFHHARISDLTQERFRVKIHRMEGNVHIQRDKSRDADDMAMGTINTGIGDFCVQVYVYGGSRHLCQPVATSYRAFTQAWCWDEWLTLPFVLADLPRDSKLIINVTEPEGPGRWRTVGGSVVDLFTTGGLLRRGYVTMALTQQETEVDHHLPDVSLRPKTSAGRMHAQIHEYWEGRVPHVPWLDDLVARGLQDDVQAAMRQESTQLYLKIELPCYATDVLYSEKGGVLSRSSNKGHHDPELYVEDNLVEEMYHQQLSSNDQLAADKHDKPNPATRDKLRDLLRRPPGTELQAEEYNLLWRFRYYLTRDKKAVVKVMRSVHWDIPVGWLLEDEVARAEEVLPLWDDVDMDDALELLGKQFWHHVPRQYAVQRLRKADAAELAMYSLQLVQAMKYEPHLAVKPQAAAAGGGKDKKQSKGARSDSSRGQAVDTAASQLPSSGGPANAEKKKPKVSDPDLSMRLDNFMLEQCTQSLPLATSVYWYLRVEASDDKSLFQPIYRRVFGRFTKQFESTSSKRINMNIIGAGADLLEKLQQLSRALVEQKLDRPKRIEELRKHLASSKHFQHIPNIPLPINPSVIVTGVRADNAFVFKSAMMPLGLTFTTKDGPEYAIVLKSGDDLRQDQLVLQIIRLMDQLLKKENLDLRLTPYACLATGVDTGLVEMVSDCQAIAKISNIHKFLLERHPDPNNEGQVLPQIMDNYVRSCAGYCVITYLLGIGDRHLDNLLLRSDGHLFHIDFGYFLGRDPKPYPPAMKLTKDMMEAMGGTNGEAAQRFRSHCHNCFLILRKHANLILNLVGLMMDSNVQDIAYFGDKAVSKVYDKFKLELDDEQAVKYFQDLLEASIAALFPRLVEALHTLAQNMRK
eukprot:TRINITY_DN9656_c0_g1_i4.p1 TRINITY_DN9656_c0_g1~~TRINITY_DN9656_c0_g1_i4.p1  ORF type:complete len:873 (+),score=193.66 TRINITY_DN9656_c0_g1_i4:22-2640(+)